MTETRQPDSGLRALDRLVGTWKLSGGVTGTSTYRWADGGFFLLQESELEHEGDRHRSLEVIGRERPFGAEESSAEIKARTYTDTGDTLDYVYELDRDTLTIWGGEIGSPAYFRGRFTDGGDTIVGGWVWPGGGYDVTITRA